MTAGAAPARAPEAGPSQAARDQARRGLYVHVPFCARRCSYCDFATGAISAEKVERYLAALEREAERRAADAAGVAFTSVFFGGGTPSVLSARHFGRVRRAIGAAFDLAPGAEITLEANPESVRPELLEAWAATGVNRLSMGAQSFDGAELSRLGRIHAAGRPAAALAMARAHGFRRLSLDLMFGFPGHTMESWRRTLEAALALEPEHLSAYCFIAEAGTPLGDAAIGGAQAPSAEAQRDMYDLLTERLAAAGFGLYETSNFARPGGECRHNLVYWLRRDHLGLGPSAHGTWRGVREAGHRALERWARAIEAGAPWAEREPETAASRADEILMLGLRLGCGLEARDHDGASLDALTRRYGAALEAGVSQGRLERTPGGWRIAAEHRFVADEVVAWLMARAVDPEPAAARADLTVRASAP